MHSYSDGKGRTPYVDIVLTTVSAAGTAGAIALATQVFRLGPLHLALVGLALFGLIFYAVDWLFTHFLWRLIWIKPWGGVCNFRGDYTANLPGIGGAAILKIRQNWRKIKVSLTINDWVFRSFTAAVVFKRLGTRKKELVVTIGVDYLHPGVETATDRFGTLILERCEGGDVLNGTCFTDSKSKDQGPLRTNGKPIVFKRS